MLLKRQILGLDKFLIRCFFLRLTNMLKQPDILHFITGGQKNWFLRICCLSIFEKGSFCLS